MSTINPLPEILGGAVFKIVDPSRREIPAKCKRAITRNATHIRGKAGTAQTSSSIILSLLSFIFALNTI